MKFTFTNKVPAFSTGPARRVYNEPHEGAPDSTRVTPPEKAEGKEGEILSAERASLEARAVYADNWNRLQQKIAGWADSDNEKIRELAKNCAEELKASGLKDFSREKNLSVQSMVEFIDRLFGIFRKFMHLVHTARIKGPKAAEKPKASKETGETLDQAYKRYQLVLNANVSAIAGWKKEIASGKYAMNKPADEAVSQLAGFASTLQKNYGGLEITVFKDPAGVDRMIGAINDYMEKKVGPFYNGLVADSRKLMAERNAEKKKKTV